MSFDIIEHIFAYFYTFNLVDPTWVVGALTTIVTAMAVYLVPKLLWNLIGWFV